MPRICDISLAHSCAVHRPDSSVHLSRRRVLVRFGRWSLAAPWLLAGCQRATGSAHALEFKGIDVSGASYGRDFHLSDVDGRARQLADFLGQVVMLYFGFAQCPDVCPTALARAVQVRQMLGTDAARLQLVFVTVDPERDTHEVLRNYMAAFDPGFLALAGSAAQIRAAADEFRVFYQRVPTGSSYTMDHTAITYLFDPSGHLRVALRHEQTAEDYAADVKALLADASI